MLEQSCINARLLRAPGTWKRRGYTSSRFPRLFPGLLEDSRGGGGCRGGLVDSFKLEAVIWADETLLEVTEAFGFGVLQSGGV